MKTVRCKLCGAETHDEAALTCQHCETTRAFPAISTSTRNRGRKAIFSRIEPTNSQRMFLGSADLPAQNLDVPRARWPLGKTACAVLCAAAIAATALCFAAFSANRSDELLDAATAQPPIAVTEDAKVPIGAQQRPLETTPLSKAIAQ